LNEKTKILNDKLDDITAQYSQANREFEKTIDQKLARNSDSAPLVKKSDALQKEIYDTL